MLTLTKILLSLRARARPLTHEETLHLRHVNLELVGTPNDAARWRILEREGLDPGYPFERYADLLNELERLRRSGRK